MEEVPNPELERAIRVRIIHDVRKPLRPTVEIRMKEGKVVMFDVKYERLLTFCYGCGLLGHGAKDCDEGPYEDEELRYREDIRASPWKVIKTPNESKGGAARNLNERFNEEQKRREQEDLDRMIGKLQSIALRAKGKTRTQDTADRHNSMIVMGLNGVHIEEGCMGRTETGEQNKGPVCMEVEKDDDGVGMEGLLSRENRGQHEDKAQQRGGEKGQEVQLVGGGGDLRRGLTGLGDVGTRSGRGDLADTKGLGKTRKRFTGGREEAKSGEVVRDTNDNGKRGRETEGDGNMVATKRYCTMGVSSPEAVVEISQPRREQ